MSKELFVASTPHETKVAVVEDDEGFHAGGVAQPQNRIPAGEGIGENGGAGGQGQGGERPKD